MLRAARRGDDAAWATIYDELAGPLLGYLRGRGAPDPEDTLGEVLLQVVRGLDRFSGDERGFRAWVFTIAHRRLVDARRERSRTPVDPTEHAELDAAAPGDATDPARLEAVTTDEVIALLDRLTDEQREVLLLRLVGGLTTVEVAEVTGRTTEAVKALSKRGIARLRELTGLGPTPDRPDPPGPPGTPDGPDDADPAGSRDPAGTPDRHQGAAGGGGPRAESTTEAEERPDAPPRTAPER